MMIKNLVNLSKISKQMLILVFDIFSIIVCLFASFSIRLDYLFYPTGDIDLLLSILISPILAVIIFKYFGLYREVIRYLGFEALWYIFKAVSLYAVLWSLITFIFAVDYIPRSVFIINWLLVIVIIGGSRFFARWVLLDSIKNVNRVLIYGAGNAGRQLHSGLSESGINPYGFIDDSSEIHHKIINGLKVYSQDDLKGLIKDKHIKEVLLAIPSLSKSRRKEIINFLEPYQLIVRSVPGMTDLAQGKVKVNDLFEIDLRDLLGRDQVKPNKKLLEINISKKVVLVTGAGGSIGSELCRQILFLKPKKVILFDFSEPALYIIEQELIALGVPNVEVFPVIGSVVDKERIQYICNYYEVQTIYHAAAYKHVPLVEFNPTQGVINNVIGTMNVAKAAIASNVETFVLISTDKAVRSTSIMGRTKRVAELVLQALSKQQDSTCFTMVRFGNVLDSSGSVIPLFKKQIQAGGPITVTHVDVVRYFMSIPEAVELVIQAGAMAEGGEVFLLDMGEPVRIYDLAVKMIQLSGLQVLDKNHPMGDIEIIFTGLRPGEKLYEELLVSGSFSSSENKLIMRAEEQMMKWNELEPILNKIQEAAENFEVEKIKKLLNQLS
jgi:FlaA1/EpsC-like NDP-sugar epimerase